MSREEIESIGKYHKIGKTNEGTQRLCECPHLFWLAEEGLAPTSYLIRPQFLMGMERLELSRVAPHGPQPCASTSSATSPLSFVKLSIVGNQDSKVDFLTLPRANAKDFVMATLHPAGLMSRWRLSPDLSRQRARHLESAAK